MPLQPLSKEQEILFRELVEHKSQTSNNDIIEAKNQRGPSKKLLILRFPRIPSDKCATSTLRARSAIHESFESMNVCNVDDTNAALNHQRSLVVKRNKCNYIEVCQETGIVPKGAMSLVSMKLLKSQLPWSMLRFVKFSFQAY